MDFVEMKNAFTRAIEFSEGKSDEIALDFVSESHYLAETMNEQLKPKTKRRQILEEAAELVDGDRQAAYGDPNTDFQRTAIYWSTHAGGVFRRRLFETGEVVSPHILEMIDSLFSKHDVAAMMAQLKISRIAWSPEKRDNWTDGAGYFACGYDCVDE